VKREISKTTEDVVFSEDVFKGLRKLATMKEYFFIDLV